MSGEQKHRVWIYWGDAAYDDETRLSEYEFDTEAEVNAFLRGVDECSGWLDHQQFDSQAELDEWRREQQAARQEQADG